MALKVWVVVAPTDDPRRGGAAGGTAAVIADPADKKREGAVALSLFQPINLTQ